MIETKVDLTILKPIDQVFAAVLDPKPFFIGKSTGLLQEGKSTTWSFEDFPMEFPVDVEKVKSGETIRFHWGEPANRTAVEFQFRKFDNNSTTVSVTESGWPDSPAGRENCKRNTSGWMHMLCSLKAYLEYAVNLRKGSFIHMKGKIPDQK